MGLGVLTTRLAWRWLYSKEGFEGSWPQILILGSRAGRRRLYILRARSVYINRERTRRQSSHCIHRNPVKRGLVAKPEDWKWSSYCHDQTGVRGTVEIESEWMGNRQSGPSSPVPEGEGPGAPLTESDPSWDRGHPPDLRMTACFGWLISKFGL